ncbi:copper resistance CopC family protein [Spirillospora sp. NPDC052242]
MKLRNPRTPRRRRTAAARIGLVTALAAALGVLTTGPALAHTRLVDSTPGRGASAAAVTEVRLVFGTDVTAPQVVVRGEDGTAFQDGRPEVSGGTVVQPLKGELPAGTYTVAYRVVGEDGHPVQSDDLAFTAAAGDGAAARNAYPPEAIVLERAEPAAAKEDSGSGVVTWVIIGVGVLIGIGIGLAIVSRATRKHTREQGKGGPR